MAVVNGTIPSAVQKLDEFLHKYPSVKLVHIQYADLSAVIRSRLVPVQTFRQTISSSGRHPGSGSIADTGMPSSNAITPELLVNVMPTAKIVPDVSSLRLSYDSANLGNTATVLADIIPDAGLIDVDARSLLARTVSNAKENQNLTFLVGHELEFYFMERDGSVPADTQVGLHNSSITSRSRYWPVLNEVLVALAEQGINAVEAHKEYAPTQFEIALPPRSPVESADILIYARETIRDIAYRHNLHVSFYVEPFAKEMHYALNGAHIHISATPTDTTSSSFNPNEFLGGLLSHVPALCGIGMTSVDSYGRTDGMGCGANVAWGENNRSTAIRLVTKDHWEVRCSDASSNPYLMTAAVIAAGLDKRPLTFKEIDSKFGPLIHIKKC